MSLKTDYKDAELASSMSGKRQYEITTNSAGYSVLTDKTAYTEVGDTFGADDINATNTKVNSIDSSLSALSNRFKVISGTLGNNDTSIAVDYPSGFTKENTMVISKKAYSNAINLWCDSTTPSSNITKPVIQIVYNDNNMSVWNRTGANGGAYSILLMRTDF